MSIPVIAVFDIGKTNKKVILFDEDYKIVHAETRVFSEIHDEDGFPAEDIHTMSEWVRNTRISLLSQNQWDIKAFNVSGYGASFVLLDSRNEIGAPLYNYLKPFPDKLKKQFYGDYGGEDSLALATASPVLGNLNSGLQLYRLKYEQPGIFNKIQTALHLPQYISFILTGKLYSDITSIGCHTHLWDFGANQYHRWVLQEGIDKKLAPILKSKEVIRTDDPHRKARFAGVGLHDSSAALLPYMASVSEPFILISTGTWCISLNPFNNSLLTADEIHKDCLCYLSIESLPVKASRIFAGHDHDTQTLRLSEHFNKDKKYCSNVSFDPEWKNSMVPGDSANFSAGSETSYFKNRDISSFDSFEAGYHQLMADIMVMQYRSTKLVIGTTHIKKIFVDGGFGKNDVFMNLLAAAFPDVQVYGATVAQASALGAALALHSSWNSKSISGNIIGLKHFP